MKHFLGLVLLGITIGALAGGAAGALALEGAWALLFMFCLATTMWLSALRVWRAIMEKAHDTTAPSEREVTVEELKALTARVGMELNMLDTIKREVLDAGARIDALCDALGVDIARDPDDVARVVAHKVRDHGLLHNAREYIDAIKAEELALSSLQARVQRRVREASRK